LAAEALAAIAQALLRQRLPTQTGAANSGARTWAAAERRSWAAALVARLTSSSELAHTLQAGPDGEGSLCVLHLPSPLTILQGGSGGKRMRRLASLERSLRLVRAVLGQSGAASAKSQIDRAVVVELPQEEVSVSAMMDISRSDMLEEACSCAALVVAVLSRDYEQSACKKGEKGQTRQPTQRARRQGLQLIVEEMMLWLRARPDVLRSEAAGCKELRGSAGLLLRALCSETPEDEQWEACIRMAIDWAELQAAPVFGAAVDHSGAECCAALATSASSSQDRAALATSASSSQDRREQLLSSVASRVAVLAARCVEEDGTGSTLNQLCAVADALAVLLQQMPRWPVLRGSAVTPCLAAVHGLLVLSTGAEEEAIRSALDVDVRVSLSLHAGAVLLGLFTHLATPLLHSGRGQKRTHRQLAVTEALLLRVSGLQSREAIGLVSAQGVVSE
ncbi:unnamed protein product, partial [Polarella glacialis]